jgi:3'-5' exoribonuclease
MIQDNAGKKSARKADMVPGQKPDEGHPLYALLPHPIKREEWDSSIEKLLSYCTDEQLIKAIREYADVLFKPYSQYPAATNVHHAFPGGLLNHTYQMLHMLEGLYPCLPYAIKVERCILAILFHDYGKLYEYNKEGDPQSMKHLLGHIYISANRLQMTLEEKGIPKDEIYYIVHIVLAHHGQLDFGSPVLPCTQEAVIVHYLDDLSAKVDIIENTGNGEKNFALGTTVVKSS